MSSEPPTPSPAAGPSVPSVPPELPQPKPQVPLTGFRAALEHTGLPRGVLTWKPRLPSRNWTIFWTIIGTVSYIYYDDRRKCKQIKAEYIAKVKHMGEETFKGSFDQPRKVTVYGAKWAEDDDTDRALRYFRKYVKPYLVAAAIDYEQVSAPLHGSITRQVQAHILKKRRQALGLEPQDAILSLPHALQLDSPEQRELEGGVVLVGRATLREYLEGMKRGWTSGVDAWDWERDVDADIQYDGVFDQPPEPTPVVESTSDLTSTPTLTPPTPSPSHTPLGFLSRPLTPVSPPTPSSAPTPPSIPSHFHIPPIPLPPTPPILLVPFTNHLGFRQTPYIIYDFFTEHRRVQQGADAALALIMQQTRPFNGPTDSSPDVDFDQAGEKWYTRSFFDLPNRIRKAKEDYYPGLQERLETARKFARGEREMTDAEKKSGKIVTEADLREERRKRELRWHGNLEGFEIIKPDHDVTWDDRFEGWLRVYKSPEDEP